MSGSELLLSDSDKVSLLRLARSAMESKLLRKSLPDFDDAPENLKAVASCFVTLHTSDGNLRGCIGNIGAFEPLIMNILHNAVNSAFGDPRFAPVSSKEELDSLELEISVLSNPAEISSLDEFVIGKHGIIIQKNRRSAVFLPQVAPEQGWNKDMTLTHLSMKAGLAPDAWRDDDAVFSVFTATVFAEKDFPGEVK